MEKLASWGVVDTLVGCWDHMIRMDVAPVGTTMPQTVQLPDDLADALADEASRLGMSLPDYAVRLLASARPTLAELQNGTDLVAYWRSEGLVGSRPEILDSQVEARQLREQAQRRGG